ncbi:MAG: ArsR/SmtB family transcription factor [Halobacteriaceae archaeon]
MLGDEYAQAILAATSREPMSAKQLSTALDADVSTIYRHVNELVERDILVERTQIVSDGSHHSLYEANVDHVEIDIDAGEISVELHVRESPAQRFTRIWDDIRGT